ncbi:MAG: hypothetical protein EA369_01105 [Bradymonadales bacterium]|nr:MAG: hypothetical protein EA369_01105 [Bradymonadales bacterium]
MKWLRLGLLLGSLFISSVELHLEAKCRVGLEELGERAGVSRELLFDQTTVLEEALLKWVAKNSRLPSLKEFAEHNGVSQAALKRYFSSKTTPKNLEELFLSGYESFPEILGSLEKRIIGELAKFMKQELREPTEEEQLALVGEGLEFLQTALFSGHSLWEILASDRARDLEVIGNKVLTAYTRIARETGRTPTAQETAEVLGISMGDFHELLASQVLFTDWPDLKEKAFKKNPNSFKSVIDTEFFGIEREEAALAELVKKGGAILTSATAGKPVVAEAFAALLRMAEEKDLPILVRPVNLVTTGLDSALLNHPRVHVVTHTHKLTPYLTLNDTKIIDRQIKSLTGLQRMGRRGESQIFGSPKMMLTTTPTLHNDKRPHMNWTTGSITVGRYAGKKLIQDRVAKIATHDHVIGAILIEANTKRAASGKAEDQGHFFARHIEYVAEAQGFTDLNRFYTATGSYEIQAEALVLGDIHVGETDPKLLESLPKLIKLLRPKRIVLHDLFSAFSISPHDANRKMNRAVLAEEGKFNLEDEIREAAEFVNWLTSISHGAEIVVVHSNHDNMLHRYLNDGRFIDEPQNIRIGAELTVVFVDFLKDQKRAPEDRVGALDPLHAGLNKFLNEEAKAQMRFLNRGETYQVGPPGREVELGLHGHVGANGAKGSVASFRKGVDAMVFGHTHTVERDHRIVNVGTFTLLKLPYALEGLSSWVQSLAIVGPHAEIQLLTWQDAWFREDSRSRQSKNFYPEGYPHVVPQNSPDSGDFDQYGGEPEQGPNN